MRPRASFPLWREKGLCNGIQTSPRPRTDPNYRFGLSQTQSTFHQIMLECIHFFLPPQQNKQKHRFWVNCLWLESAVTGVSSQEELLEWCQTILVGSSLTKGSMRLHGTHKWTPVFNHHLVEYFFVLKWLCSPTEGCGFNTLCSVSSTSTSAPKLSLADSLNGVFVRFWTGNLSRVYTTLLLWSTDIYFTWKSHSVH